MSEARKPIDLDQELGSEELPAVAGLPAGFVIGGKYAVKRRLGLGASGAVYEGEHTTIGHRVAIKVVHRALAEREDIIQRFQLEAKICGKIRDRHVGQVYDVGMLDDGAPYMVMELHEGGSLGDVLDESKLSIAVIVDIARQLLAGLAAAHRAGAVHRDVKPDNIMLVREASGQTVVKLVDFGISKNVQADISERNVTREGTVVGSPDYMPPEQLRGDEVDLRADLYSVGVLLYQALTQKMPFDAPSLTELIVAIMRDPVPPVTSLRADCPPALEQVVQKAMSRNREQRYASAEAMSHALAEVQLGAQLSPDASLGALRESAAATHGAGGVTQTRRRHSASLATEGPRVPTAELQLPRKPKTALWIGLGVIASAGLVFALLPSAGTPAANSGAAPMLVQPAAQLQTPVLVVDTQPAPEPPEPAPTAAAAPAVEPVPAQPTEAVPAPAIEPPADARRPTPTRNTAARRAPDATRAPDMQAQPPQAEPVAAAEAQDTQALLQAANGAFLLGQMPRARGLYQKIVALSPKQADAWRGLGLVSSRMGQRSEAVRAYERYLELRPGAADAARIREQLGKLK